MSKVKRKYCRIRKKFKIELYESVKNNIVYIPMIIETYAAQNFRNHIHKIWYMSIGYPAFQKEYNEKLFGKMLCGRNEILNNLCYIDKKFNKYKYRLPERLAMGDALAIAYRVDRENQIKK